MSEGFVKTARPDNRDLLLHDLAELRVSERLRESSEGSAETFRQLGILDGLVGRDLPLALLRAAGCTYGSLLRAAG